MATPRLAIIGAGGLAREVEWLVRDINREQTLFECVGYVVSDLTRLGEYDEKARVLGDYSVLANIDAAVIGIGTPASRLRVAADLASAFPHLEWPSLLHPTVRIDSSTAFVGRGVVVTAGVVATVNIHLEDHSFVNLCCTIGHEARIGRGSVLNPSVNISGGVRIGEGVLIGTGAQVLQYLTVGDGAIVGAGAVVAKNVDPGVTVVGIPAKPK